MAACLPPGWKPRDDEKADTLYSIKVGRSTRPGIRQFHLLYHGLARLVRTENLEEVFEKFESDLQITIASIARRRLFVHAGVVTWKDRAILIPGRSYTGKSSLVAALVRAGATYYSDEYAVLDDKGWVHPYPRLLSLRQGDDRPPLRCGPEALGGVAGRKPAPVGLVVVSHFKEGSRWRPRALTPGQGTLELLANTVPARHRPGKALQVLGRVAREVPVLKSARGEADQAAAALLAYLDRSSSTA